MIKSVATIVQRAVRDIGMAFRYGGEEFLVLLPGLTKLGRTSAPARSTPRCAI
ncbi:membrane-bound diguanylate cyclase [Klebsiella pneumoniae]|uniref:Membrane-bound diguanylate cyclase n=1 Tax=Klebsiella pneumoniae TaxID=573 RepID=A0A2X3H0S3_KLEPN|nr:membrane-bound diguanylate cyclase [Klebsiella pneumoniae]